MTIQLYVGFVGEDRNGRTVRITGKTYYQDYPWEASCGTTYSDDGSLYKDDTDERDVVCEIDESLKLKFKRLHPDFVLPKYETAGAAAFDLVALADGVASPVGGVEKIPLGFAVEIPIGYALLLTTRSSMGARYGAGVPQGFGLIDSDYRGELSMLILTSKLFHWKKGDRIGQATLVPVIQAQMELVEELSETERGEGGFGSTGK